MRFLWITVVAILIDQFTKFIVVKNMFRGDSIPVLGEWLRLTYTENPGMAFGINFGPPGMVTGFSIIATILIIVYLYTVRHGYGPYVASLAAILGGALGNIIDRVFYGWIRHGDSLFTGKVVDFIHFDIWRGYIPEWFPVLGGSYLALFPIWNVADMVIVGGVIGIITFQHRFHEDQLALLRNEEAGSPAPAPIVAPDKPVHAPTDERV